MTTSDLKQQIRTLYICSKNIYRRGLKKPTKTVQALRALKVIKLLRNLFVLKAGLNFRIFLRLKVHVLRAGRSSWSLFCSFCKTFLNSLSTSSWRRSESLVRPDSTKASLYEQRGKMMRITRFYSFKFDGEVNGKVVMKDRTRILCDRTNTSAEKLD